MSIIGKGVWNTKGYMEHKPVGQHVNVDPGHWTVQPIGQQLVISKAHGLLPDGQGLSFILQSRCVILYKGCATMASFDLAG